jgi:hypothetical protein
VTLAEGGSLEQGGGIIYVRRSSMGAALHCASRRFLKTANPRPTGGWVIYGRGWSERNGG